MPTDASKSGLHMHAWWGAACKAKPNLHGRTPPAMHINSCKARSFMPARHATTCMPMQFTSCPPSKTPLAWRDTLSHFPTAWQDPSCMYGLPPNACMPRQLKHAWQDPSLTHGQTPRAWQDTLCSAHHPMHGKSSHKWQVTSDCMARPSMLGYCLRMPSQIMRAHARFDASNLCRAHSRSAYTRSARRAPFKNQDIFLHARLSSRQVQLST